MLKKLYLPRAQMNIYKCNFLSHFHLCLRHCMKYTHAPLRGSMDLLGVYMPAVRAFGVEIIYTSWKVSGQMLWYSYTIQYVNSPVFCCSVTEVVARYTLHVFCHPQFLFYCGPYCLNWFRFKTLFNSRFITVTVVYAIAKLTRKRELTTWCSTHPGPGVAMASSISPQ